MSPVLTNAIRFLLRPRGARKASSDQQLPGVAQPGNLPQGQDGRDFPRRRIGPTSSRPEFAMLPRCDGAKPTYVNMERLREHDGGQELTAI